MTTHIIDLAWIATPVWDSLVDLITAATGLDVEKSAWFRARYKRFGSPEEARRSYDRTCGYVALRGGKIVMDEALAAVLTAAGITIAPELEAALLAEWQRLAPNLPRPTVAPPAAVATLCRELAQEGKDPANLYAMLAADRHGTILCQLRVDQDAGKKIYIPYSYVSGPGLAPTWICAEPWCMPDSVPDHEGNFPEFKLPFWKPTTRRNLPKIMLHEGAKTAWVMDNLINNKNPEWEERRQGYPKSWFEYFATFEHWGIIGGARSPQRSNFKELQAMQAILVVYSCDRDPAGEAAVQIVSEYYQGSLDFLKWGRDFPLGWDLADAIPDHLFKNGFCTRAIQSFLHPGTFATRITKIVKEKKQYVITEAFLKDWLYVEKNRLFIHERFQYQQWREADFNTKIMPFSHAGRETSFPFLKHGNNRIGSITYDPSKRSGPITMDHDRSGDISGFNVYTPSRIRPQKGDIQFWKEYLEFLFPDAEDRKQVTRWIYTLLVHPEIKMKYYLLLHSEETGVGKTRLYENVLVPLLGWDNTTTVSEEEVLEKYTSWQHQKRLVHVSEIYNKDGTAKLYQKLLSAVDNQYRVNEKYEIPYTSECWTHLFCSSNHENAIKINNTDRRWFIPKVTETIMPTEFATELLAWLEGPGLPAILWHAEHWFASGEGTPVSPAERAPVNDSRQSMIEAGYSVGQQLVEDALDALVLDRNERAKTGLPGANFAVVVPVTLLIELIRQRLYKDKTPSYLEKPKAIRALLDKKVWYFSKERYSLYHIKDSYAIKTHFVSTDPEISDLTPGQLEALEKESQGKVKFIKTYSELCETIEGVAKLNQAPF